MMRHRRYRRALARWVYVIMKIPNAHSTRDASDAFVRARLKYSPYFCAHFSFPRGESRLPISHNHAPVSTFRIAKHASGGV